MFLVIPVRARIPQLQLIQVKLDRQKYKADTVVELC